MELFTGNGYTDTFRMFNQEPGHYTWWSYRFNARKKNIGWRIDYFCVNDGYAPEVEESVILKDYHGVGPLPPAAQGEGFDTMKLTKKNTRPFLLLLFLGLLVGTLTWDIIERLFALGGVKVDLGTPSPGGSTWG